MPRLFVRVLVTNTSGYLRCSAEIPRSDFENSESRRGHPLPLKQASRNAVGRQLSLSGRSGSSSLSSFSDAPQQAQTRPEKAASDKGGVFAPHAVGAPSRSEFDALHRTRTRYIPRLLPAWGSCRMNDPGASTRADALLRPVEKTSPDSLMR
jgi:hypothetical protein